MGKKKRKLFFEVKFSIVVVVVVVVPEMVYDENG